MAMSDDARVLEAFIAAVRRRWFAQAAFRAMATGFALAALPVAAAVVLDRMRSLEGAPLLAVAASTLVLAAVGALFPVWRMPRRPDDRRVARFVEERVEGRLDRRPLEDTLVSATDAERAAPAALRGVLLRGAAQRLAPLSLDDIVPAAAIRRAGMQAAGGLLLLAIVLAPASGALRRAAETAWVALVPAAIEIRPGDARVRAGEPVRIQAVVRGRRGSLTRVIPTLTVSSGGDARSVPMAADGDAFVFAFESVDRSFTYRVTAGASSSAEHTITALFPPRVTQIDLHYEYPAFTKLPERDEANGGDIYGPEGTRVRVRVHVDKPIASGELAFGSSRAASLRAGGGHVLEADLVLARDDSYRVRLTDADGLASTGDTEYFIRLMDDLPPTVRIVRPAGDQQITPLEEVVIEARADDDHGVAALELVFATPGGKTRVVPFTTSEDTEVARIGRHLLAAEELRVQPGDVISYYARARDVARGKRPTETRSDLFFLEVRPFNEEFEAAQSQAGGGAGDPEIEGLIAAQKEIISATWNLERRSGAGRSEADVRAVAAAQAELKSRLEGLSGRAGGGLPFRGPQAPASGGGAPRAHRQIAPRRPGVAPRPDPLAGALDAMTRAAAQLERQRTADALPHEMAALQGLLQAQAEVRRRQVMQQQRGGAGGAGRQGQDLSALFDKELQRQQRTNYETRSEIEERPDRTKDDGALERIRDLARRQEELSRRQQELAEASASADELKRQLERLTREQEELREEAEALARQIDGQPQSGRQGGQGSPGATGQRQPNANGAGAQETGSSRGMRDAAEQMRGASADLERANPGGAAGRAARAAERLREMERRMRGQSPEAQQRAAGDLQLEAQQIAGEQRRIAAEAERLDRAGAAARADAGRRLAGEKDDLADRVDALQRNARELGATGATADAASARAAEAARELEQQGVSRQMRETARAMRAPTGHGAKTPAGPDAAPGQLAGREQEIARALDRVVETLGGEGAETRNLSAGLGEAQAIRRRLDALEQAIREGEAARQTEPARGRGAQPSESGRPGRQGRGANPGAGQGGDVEKRRDEYARELQRARDALARLQRGQSRDSLGGATPEHHEWSQADPGSEAFKQDYTGWESLREDVNLALERYETALSARLNEQAARDRLNAGGSDRVPDAYRRLIARYYEALARTRR
jgi:hypothetical protein